MNERIIVNIVVLVGALILALFLGNWVVSDPEGVGVGIVLVTALVLFLALNKNIWVLIPASMTLAIKFPFIPGGFSLAELISMYVVFCSFLMLLTRKVVFRLRMTSLEWLSFFILLLMLQSYLRNPVGIRLLGSEYVGGRPYVIVFFGVAAGWVLASTRTTQNYISKAFHWSILAYFGSFILNLAAQLSFTVAKYTAILFGITGGHVADTGYDAVTKDSGRADRNRAASLFARAGSRILIAKLDPIRAIIKPLWLLLLIGIILAAGVSGYRSVIATTAMILMLGAYYWGGLRSVMMAGFLALVGYIGIIVLHLVSPLPPNIQRSLTFLPGPWEERHIEDAGASTDWRVEMWKEAMYTDRYIRNKFIGDGLGISRADYMHMVQISDAVLLTDEMSQERAMLAGDFHSGPVTTIKVIGYFGLIVLTIAMLVLAWRAHRLILFSRGKPFFSQVLFFCVPMVISPIVYMFIFGSFKTSIPLWFIQIGLLRLLENNLMYSSESADSGIPNEIPKQST